MRVKTDGESKPIHTGHRLEVVEVED